jgi:hypothetical protein
MPSTIWLTDRSRIEDSRSFCKRARGINCHLGSTGYGLQRKATKLPLVTGTAIHDGFAPVLHWCMETLTDQEKTLTQLATGQAAPDQVVREAVRAAQATYWKTVETRGFAYLEDSVGVKEATREQNFLVEGLIWCWVLEVLPEILQRGRILEVEHDDTYVFGCSCGLGDGVMDQDAHEARDCDGVGLQCRPDFLVETWQTQELEYHEFKSTGMDAPSFRDKWEVMMQMFSATIDAERRHGKHVQSVYVHGLIKGKREGDYNPETGKRDGTMRQQSICCYGYRKPATPPMEPEEWRALYEYQDETGKNRRLGKNYRRTGIWELDDSYLTGGTIVSKCEWWIKAIPAEARRKNLIYLGPFSRQTQMVEHFLRETLAEERDWQGIVWKLYEKSQELLQVPGVTTWAHVWAHPDYQALLDETMPRSYACRRYGLRHKCQYEDLCFYREGWQDPEGSGRFIPRRPHHRMELEQAIARGLLLPEAGAAEGEEDLE